MIDSHDPLMAALRPPDGAVPVDDDRSLDEPLDAPELPVENLDTNTALMAALRPPEGAVPVDDDGVDLDELLELPTRGLDARAALAAIVAAQRAETMLHTKRLELMHAYATGPGAEHGEFAVDVIAAETQTSLGRTDTDLGLAGQLTERLPHTLRHLRRGRLDRARAWLIAHAASQLTTAQCGILEQQLYPAALDKHPRALRRLVNRHVLAIDPDTAAQRAAARRRDRHVTTELDTDGMGWLNAYLTTGDLEAITNRIDTLARNAARSEAPRTMDQRRADALRDLLLGANHEHVRAHIYLTVPADTVLGLADLPGELRGNGVLPAHLVRELAHHLHSTFTGLLTDDNGHLRDLSDRRYRFTGRLAEYIRLRDRVCTHPACGRPAEHCDIDHRVPHPHGPTSVANADVLCRRHHRMKHRTTWTTTRHPHATTTWTHPTGTTHHNTPEPLPTPIPQQRKPPTPAPP